LNQIWYNVMVKTIKKRFLEKVKKTKSCWLWSGANRGNGYGAFKLNGKTLSAHRVSYELFIGVLPENMLVCHKCDNPSCVNPEHLFVGTPLDNNIDMWKKGRWVSGAKTKYDRDYIISQHGVKDCFKVAEELGCSWSLVCYVWRKNGLSGRLWSNGNKRSV